MTILDWLLRIDRVFPVAVLAMLALFAIEALILWAVVAL